MRGAITPSLAGLGLILVSLVLLLFMLRSGSVGAAYPFILTAAVLLYIIAVYHFLD